MKVITVSLSGFPHLIQGKGYNFLGANIALKYPGAIPYKWSGPSSSKRVEYNIKRNLPYLLINLDIVEQCRNNHCHFEDFTWFFQISFFPWEPCYTLYFFVYNTIMFYEDSVSSRENTKVKLHIWKLKLVLKCFNGNIASALMPS